MQQCGRLDLHLQLDGWARGSAAARTPRLRRAGSRIRSPHVEPCRRCCAWPGPARPVRDLEGRGSSTKLQPGWCRPSEGLQRISIHFDRADVTWVSYTGSLSMMNVNVEVGITRSSVKPASLSRERKCASFRSRPP